MKLKNLYLVLFMLCMSTAIFAQDKYEQAIVSQYTRDRAFIYLSIEGQEYKKIKVEGEDYNDFSPLLKQIANLRSEGWEVWNSNSLNVGKDELGITYFLRRKLK